ncbi:MAG: alcohol dehydrogenase catalytic domain-containing protein, partial [Vulcanisaeta sp.]
IRRGYPGIRISLPHVPGADVVGVIERVGPNTWLKDFGVGDLVLVNNVWGCGHCRFCRAGLEDHCPSWTMPGLHVWGGYGEFVKVPAKALVRSPKFFSVAELAALPLAYSVSWKALRVSNVREGDWVLVIAGSGGIGTALTILAKALGARVIAVAARGDVLRRLGADVVVGYDANELMSVVSEKTEFGVDVAIDVIGDTLSLAIQAVRPGGTVVTFGVLGNPSIAIDIRRFYLRHGRLIGIHNSSKFYLEELLDFMVSRGIKPFITDTVSIKEAPRLHGLMESRGVVGKVVMVHDW